jgi:hypothetical protein
MSDKRTYYFGCIGAKGHYMFPAVSMKKTRQHYYPALLRW